MSYSYSYKSSNSSRGPGGSSYSIQSPGPVGSSNYSYRTSSHSASAGQPRMADDAEFQAAKMQAMMGSPAAGSGGSYSYQSSSSSSTPTVKIAGGANTVDMEAEMLRRQREMESSMRAGKENSGNGSYTFSQTSSSGSTPKLIHPEPSSGGTTVKKIVTTTTTKSNPQAVRELESIERDFSRLGRTPDNYQDDFDKLRKDVLTGEAYSGSTTAEVPVRMQVREESVRSSQNEGRCSDTSTIPVTVQHGSGRDGIHEVKTTTTTRTFGSGAPSVSEEKVVTTSGGTNGLHMSEYMIIIDMTCEPLVRAVTTPPPPALLY